MKQPLLQGEDLHRIARTQKAVAAGLDGVFPDEAKLYPREVWDAIAAIFLSIEDDAPWPDQLLHAKAAFLQKPGEAPDAMSSLRVLRITPVIYRIWAKCRSRQLGPWTRTWVGQDLYATAQGSGAMDAHMDLSMRIEDAVTRNMEHAGVVSDLSQAFDRLLPQIIVPVAIRAGFPRKLLMAWLRYVQHLQVTTAYVMGFGKTRRRTVSIPQGCPHSMRMLGLVVAPWCRMIRANGMIPRALADDLTAYAEGEGATAKVMQAALYTM